MRTKCYRNGAISKYRENEMRRGVHAFDMIVFSLPFSKYHSEI